METNWDSRRYDLGKVEALARTLHAGQMWEDGVAYIDGHLLPVASLAIRLAEIDGLVNVENVGAAALLHDVIEDVLLARCGSLEAAMEWLCDQNVVTSHVVAVVAVLTMIPGETRVGYMTRVAASPFPEVRITKSADDLFNSDPVTLAKLGARDPKRAIRLGGKYERDRAILGQANVVLNS